MKATDENSFVFVGIVDKSGFQRFRNDGSLEFENRCAIILSAAQVIRGTRSSSANMNKKAFNDVIGILLVIVSCVFNSLAGVITRYMSFEMNAIEIFTLRCGSQLIVSATAALILRVDLKQFTEAWKLLLAFSVFDSFATLGAHYSLSLISVRDVSVIMNCRHVFTLPIAKYWLKEDVGFVDLIAIIISVASLVLICQPPFMFGILSAYLTTSRILGMIAALVSMLLNSVGKCFNRKLQDVHLSVLIVLPAISGTLLGGCLLPTSRIQNPFQIKSSYMVLLVVSMGFFSNLSQTAALQLTSANNVAVFVTLRLPFALLFEMLILDDFPNLLSSMGCLLSSISLTMLATKSFLNGWCCQNRIRDERESLPCLRDPE